MASTADPPGSDVLEDMQKFLMHVRHPNDAKHVQAALLLSRKILKAEPKNKIVKQYVPVLFQLAVAHDEDGKESAEEDDDDDNDTDDDDDSSSSDEDRSDDTDEDEAPEPQPEISLTADVRSRRAIRPDDGDDGDSAPTIDVAAAEKAAAARAAVYKAELKGALAEALAAPGEVTKRD